MNLIFLFVVGVLAVSFLAALALSRRSVFARVTASVFALGFAAFCAFGFLASFELSDSPLSTWHLAYAILGIGSLITVFLGLRGAKTSDLTAAAVDSKSP
jgi:hypothetical protein